jgi:hypothetical protein
MTAAEYLHDLVTQRLPLGIVKKLFIYDKDGKKVDFSDKFETNGTNRLIDYGTIETVIEGNFNHFYNKSGDISVRNNDRFFNKPFPSTLKDVTGDSTEFLKDSSGIINIFKKPGYSTGTSANARYTILEVGADLEIGGKQFTVKLATLLLTKIITDSKAEASIKTDGLIQIAMDTSAEKVVDGQNRWYIQKPMTFLISEILKLAYGYYDTATQKLKIPEGFVIPKFLDTIQAFNSAVNGAFGRPPVQTDEDSDGEPDFFPSTDKICRALWFDYPNYVYLGIDEQIWKFNLNTWVFSFVKTIRSDSGYENFIIEDISELDYDGFHCFRVRGRLYLQEIISAAFTQKFDVNLKTHKVYIGYFDYSNWTELFSTVEDRYDSEFNYFSTLGHLICTNEYASGNYFIKPIYYAYSAGMAPWQTGKLHDALQENATLLEWMQAQDADETSFLDSTSLEGNLFMLVDNAALYLTGQTAQVSVPQAGAIPVTATVTVENAKYVDLTLGTGFKTLNIPIPFSQTIYFSSPGEMTTLRTNVISHTIALMRSKTLKGIPEESDSYYSTGTNTFKKPDFTMSKGYYAVYGQVHTVNFDGRFDLTKEGLGVDFFNSLTDYENFIKDIKYSLGQKGINEVLKSVSTSKRYYELSAISSKVKVGTRFCWNFVKGDPGPLDAGLWGYLWPYHARKIWYEVLGAVDSSIDSNFGYYYPGISIKTITLDSSNIPVSLTEIYNLRMLLYNGREAQPLCSVMSIENFDRIWLSAISFETLDGNRFVDSVSLATTEDREFESTKYARNVVYEIDVESDTPCGIVLSNHVENDKIPSSGLSYGKEDNYFLTDSNPAVIDGKFSDISKYLFKATNDSSNSYIINFISSSLQDVGTMLERDTVISVDSISGSWTSIGGGSQEEILGDYNNSSYLEITRGAGTEDVEVTIQPLINIGSLAVKVDLLGNYSVSATITVFNANNDVIGLQEDIVLSGIWDQLEVNIPDVDYRTQNLRVVVSLTWTSDATVDLANIYVEVTSSGMYKLNYKSYQARLAPNVDAIVPEANILPTGDFRNIELRCMAEIKAVFDDVAILEMVSYGEYIYLAVLMLNNISDYAIDTVYTDSPNQYAIWKISNTWETSTRTVLKTLFFQPKNLSLSDGKLLFSLEGLGIFARIDLTTEDYQEFDAINPAVPDELYTNGSIAVINSDTPMVFATSSPNGRDRYNYKITQGKYYLYQINTSYVPMIEFADFSGMSCEDVLQQFCEMINWIKGFDENGNFFMVKRNPTYTTPDLTLLESYDAKYVDITDMQNTADEIINQSAVVPYKTSLQEMKFNLSYRTRGETRTFPDMTLDGEQRDIYKKTIDLICIRDGVVSLDSEDTKACPLFRWKIIEVETAIRIVQIADATGSTTLYLASVFGGNLTTGGIHINDWLKFKNSATEEYVFRKVTDVDEEDNTVDIEEAFGFTLEKDLEGSVVKSRNIFYSDERVAMATPVSGENRFTVDTLDNIGVGTILENTEGLRTIVRDKYIDSYGIYWVAVDTADFVTGDGTIKGYWSPMVSNVLYEIGGNSVYVKLSMKDSNQASAEYRTFYSGDYLQLECPGLKLEQDEMSKQVYIDSTSVATYGLVEEDVTGKKFMTRPLARNYAKMRVLENSAPRFKGTVSSIFLPQLTPVVKTSALSRDGRLFVVRLQSSAVFPLIQGNSVDFYITAIKHSLNKRSTEFSVKGIKPIGQ